MLTSRLKVLLGKFHYLTMFFYFLAQKSVCFAYKG